ncbi:hypothetical protein GGR51DRAFT_538007 [Nemania sp. FL0031]|nr:hypothetical protein GGR51DRAFT_538007 [Nemania sp. FL0031]
MPNFKRVQLYSPIIFGSYIHMIKGNFKIAEKQLLQALNDRKEEYKIEDDVKSKRSGHILYCLGNVVSKDRPFEGSEYFHRSLKVFQQTGSDFDLDLAQCCYKLAQYYLQEESSDTATQMIDKAIEIFSHYKYFEPHHARALWVKSQIMSQTGDCKGAHAMEIEALEILRGHVSGDREWSTALSLEDLDQLVPVWDR